MAIDREMLRQHLGQSENSVTSGERLIARQRAIVTELQRDGHDTADAQMLLAAFEKSLRIQIAILDRLRAQLADAEST